MNNSVVGLDGNETVKAFTKRLLSTKDTNK